VGDEARAGAVTGIVSVQGRRAEMQDRYVLVEGAGGLFGGVYDGHGGQEAAEQAAAALHAWFFEALGRGLHPEAAFAEAFRRADRAVQSSTCGTTATAFFVQGGRLTVANRTLKHARRLAVEVGGEACGLDDLDPLVARADIVVGTVGNRAGLIGSQSLAGVVRQDPRSRYFLDLAHPRNFDASLAGLPGVRLIDLEHVFRSVESARRERAAQIPLAEAIVDEAADAYMTWFRGRASVAVIRAVRARVLEMAETEVERHARGLSGEDRERMLDFAHSLARSLLHQPTAALRQADPQLADGRTLLDSAAILFGVAGAEAREPA